MRILWSRGYVLLQATSFWYKDEKWDENSAFCAIKAIGWLLKGPAAKTVHRWRKSKLAVVKDATWWRSRGCECFRHKVVNNDCDEQSRRKTRAAWNVTTSKSRGAFKLVQRFSVLRSNAWKYDQITFENTGIRMLVLATVLCLLCRVLLLKLDGQLSDFSVRLQEIN